jgi:3-oxoacyl-[acyl-carrier protein] reductase
VSGRLSGKAAVITGAASGIGAATARLFASEGALLCLNDNAEEPLSRLVDELAAQGCRVMAAPGDVADQAVSAELARGCAGAFGRIDVLVNNAGITKHAMMSELALEDWHAILAVDLTAAFLCTQAVTPQMIGQQAGRIINISSQLALRGAAGFSAYCAAKAGLIGFSKAVARELAQHGITVNCVAPGPVDTDMLTVGGNSWSNADRERLPLRRIGHPAEVAPSVLFLASEPEGNLFTGQTLGPNSGDVMP